MALLLFKDSCFNIYLLWRFKKKQKQKLLSKNDLTYSTVSAFVCFTQEWYDHSGPTLLRMTDPLVTSFKG